MQIKTIICAGYFQLFAYIIHDKINVKDLSKQPMRLLPDEF